MKANMAVCTVLHCANTEEGGYQMFHFPKNLAVRAKWVRNCGVVSKPNEDSVVCEAHFRNKDYMNNLPSNLKKLSWFAVPRISKSSKSPSVVKRNLESLKNKALREQDKAMLELCRICLNEGNILIAHEDKRSMLCSKIEACLPITISKNDNYPKKICFSCVKYINLFYEFWSKCIETDKRLYEMSSKAKACNIKVAVVENGSETVDKLIKMEPKCDILEPDISIKECGENLVNDSYNEFSDICNGNIVDYVANPSESSANHKELKSEINDSVLDKFTAKIAQNNNSDKVALSEITKNNIAAISSIIPALNPKLTRGIGKNGGIFKDRSMKSVNFSKDSDITNNSSAVGNQIDSIINKNEKIPNNREKKTKNITKVNRKTVNSNRKRSNIRNRIVSEAIIDRIDSIITENEKILRIRRVSQIGSSSDFEILNRTDSIANIDKNIDSISNEHGQIFNNNNYGAVKTSLLENAQIQNGGTSVELEIVVIPPILDDEKDITSYNKNILPKNIEIQNHQNASAKMDDEIIIYQPKVGAENPGRRKKQIRNFICEICCKLFTEKYPFDQHQATHSELRPFKCDYCDGTFKTLNLTNAHIRRQHYDNPKIYRKCDQCEKKFISKYLLKRHMKRHKRCDEGKLYNCGICGKQYVNLVNMKAHLRTHTMNNGKLEPESLSPFECEICGRNFKFKHHLLSHEKVHEEREYICDYCNKSFGSKEHVKLHINRHLTEKKPVECDVCNKIFIGENQLKNHKITHMPIETKNSHCCDFCSKKYFYKYYFDKHVDKCRTRAERRHERLMKLLKKSENNSNITSGN